MKTPFIFILLTVILTSFQTNEAELGLRQEYRQTSHTNSTVIQSFGGQDMKMEMVIKGSIVFLVQSAGNVNMNWRPDMKS